MRRLERPEQIELASEREAAARAADARARRAARATLVALERCLGVGRGRPYNR